MCSARAHRDKSTKIPPTEHPLPLRTRAPHGHACPAPRSTAALPSPLSLRRFSYQHAPLCSPRISGGLFPAAGILSKSPSTICCYQASSLLILLNFYLFPLGRLRHACVSLHMPKHLLSSALGWFLPLSSCRSESCCFLLWERDHVPEASVEECSTRRSFFVASLSRRFVVVSLSFQMATSKRDQVGLASLPPSLSACSQTLLPAREKSHLFIVGLGRSRPRWGGLKCGFQGGGFGK